MPGRGRGFGGSLLGTPEPLPDEDAAPAVPTGGVGGERGASAAAASPRGRQGPPSTLRVNDAAGAALWEGYLEAKAGDPFLSFRAYTSQVVLLGRAAEQKRARGGK